MKTVWKEVLAVALTVLIFILILSSINIFELIEHLSKSNVVVLGLSVLLFFPFVLLKSERWRILLGKYADLRLKDAARYTMASFPYMAVTPSDAGDFVRAAYIRKNVPVAVGLTSITLEKVLDVLTLAIFSLLGFVLWGDISSSTMIILIFSLVIIATIFILFFMDFVTNRFIGKVINLFCMMLRSEKTKGKMLEIREFFIRTSSRKIRKCFFITIFIWMTHFLQVYMIFLSVGIDMGITMLFTFIPISLFIGMLPITIGGIGTRDAALLYFLSPFFPSPLVLSGAVLIIFIRVWLIGLIGLPFIRMRTENQLRNPVIYA